MLKEYGDMKEEIKQCLKTFNLFIKEYYLTVSSVQKTPDRKNPNVKKTHSYEHSCKANYLIKLWRVL